MEKGWKKKMKDDLNVSKRPARTLSKYLNDYLIFKNGEEIEFFAEDGVGYTSSLVEAGVFTIQEVQYFNAKILDRDVFLSRKEIKRDYLAISILTLLKISLRK